jgi:hypothetical protein
MKKLSEFTKNLTRPYATSPKQERVIIYKAMTYPLS